MERLESMTAVADRRSLGVATLRWLGALLSIALVAAALYEHDVNGRAIRAWVYLGTALAVSMLWTFGIELTQSRWEPTVSARRRLRVLLGGTVFLAGVFLFAHASYELYLNWAGNFDRAWVTWLVATGVMAVGLDFASGPWKLTGGVLRYWHLPVLALLLVAAVAYRLGNIAEFPGEGTMTQVEDLQTGQWGTWYQNGQGRVRWEYLSHAWLAGLGVWLGGPTMLAMRVPFAVVSVLKTIPLFFWLLLVSGPAGALVGTALYVCSAWDVVLSRIPNNQNALVVATAFALLAGPARRGRPSAFVILGLLCGYLVHEYVAYRPLIFLVAIGVTWLSLRDRAVSWPARLARPLLTLSVIVAMATPLFLGRLTGNRLWDEYFNGWNRAKAIQPYYNPNSDWRQTLEKRIDRSFDALALFYFSGDSHPSRRVNQPLVDAISGALLVIGVGCAIAHFAQPVFALTFVGLGVTIAGTLVLTGNFDIGRVGGAVPYVYACIGYGAASLMALGRRRGRWTQIMVGVLLAAAVLGAAYRNTQALRGHWSSTSVKRALRSNLALLSSWLRQNAREDEQVVAVAPGFFHVLQGNDAGWLRGREMNGIAAWDVESALQYWSQNPGKTLLVVFAGPGTKVVTRYLEWLIPGLQMQFEDDPLSLDAERAHAHFDQAPGRLGEGLAVVHCYGSEGEFRLINPTTGEVRQRWPRRAPFIDAPVVPGDLRNAIHAGQGGSPTKVIAEFRGDFTIEKGGGYRFMTQAYPGTVQLSIDGRSQASQRGREINLTAGTHHFELTATLEPDPFAMVVRLFWNGPDSGGVQEIMPLYRLVPPDSACAAAPPAAASAGG